MTRSSSKTVEVENIHARFAMEVALAKSRRGLIPSRIVNVALCLSIVLSGCIAYHPSHDEKDESTFDQGSVGYEMPDSSVVLWREVEYDVADGKGVAIGFFPGAGQMWDNGKINDNVNCWIGWGALTVVANVAWAFPTWVSLSAFFFDLGREGSFISSLGLIGCHRWESDGINRTKMHEQTDSYLKKKDGADACVDKLWASGRMRDGMKYYIGYPGFDQIVLDINSGNQAVALVYTNECGRFVSKILRKSSHEVGALEFEDIAIEDGDIKARQFIEHGRVVSFLEEMERIKRHQGYACCDSGLSNKVESVNRILRERLKLDNVFHENSLADIEPQIGEFKRLLDFAYQEELVRLRKVEENRIANRKTELDSLVAEKKWNEIVSVCDAELATSLPGSRPDDSGVWQGYKSKALAELEKIRLAENARIRQEEVTRINEKKEKIERLLKEEKYAEVISQCDEEEWGNPGSTPEDAQIWQDLKSQAKEKQAEVDRRILAEQEAEMRKEQERIAKQFAIDRAVEIKRIAGVKQTILDIAKTNSWRAAVRLCDAELEMYGQRAGGIAEDRQMWLDLKKAVTPAPPSLFGVELGSDIGEDASKTDGEGMLECDFAPSRKFMTFDTYEKFANPFNRKVFRVRGVCYGASGHIFAAACESVEKKFGIKFSGNFDIFCDDRVATKDGIQYSIKKWINGLRQECVEISVVDMIAKQDAKDTLLKQAVEEHRHECLLIKDLVKAIRSDSTGLISFLGVTIGDLYHSSAGELNNTGAMVCNYACAENFFSCSEFKVFLTPMSKKVFMIRAIYDKKFGEASDEKKLASAAKRVFSSVIGNEFPDDTSLNLLSQSSSLKIGNYEIEITTGFKHFMIDITDQRLFRQSQVEAAEQKQSVQEQEVQQNLDAL